MNEARPAGFWIRAVAALVDVVLYTVVEASLGRVAAAVSDVDFASSVPFQSLLVTHTFLFASLYVVVLHRLRGQTLGKMLLGVRVVATNGESLTLGTSVLRYLAYFVSCATLGFGYVMAGLRQDKRALHDLIAGTQVLRTGDAAPRAAEDAPVGMPGTPPEEAGMV